MEQIFYNILVLIGNHKQSGEELRFEIIKKNDCGFQFEIVLPQFRRNFLGDASVPKLFEKQEHVLFLLSKVE